METWDAIRARRGEREFADRAIPREDLERIMEAARRSPSASNKQRWDFVVVTDPARLEDLSKVWKGAGHVAGAAAAVALVAPTTDDPAEARSIHYDLGQATMSIMIAAADLGVASRHAGVRDHERAAEALALPEDRTCAFLISLGYPANRPLQPIQRPDRRAFTDVVHWERY